MSRQTGSASFAGTIEVNAGGPLDARTVAGTVADLTASGTFPYPYEGMKVYVKEDKKTYKLIADDPTVSANWVEDGGSGSTDVELTMDEYEDLTPEEQMNGTNYFITDAVSGDEAKSAYLVDDTAETTLDDADYFPFYDSSVPAKRKSLWSNIKSVLKTYFDTLYQGKLTAGTNVSFNGNTINVPDNYSTSEIVIGTWLNATLYRKVVNIGNLPNNAEKQVAHNISGTSKTFVRIYGYIKDSSKRCFPIPISTVHPSICSVGADQTNINLVTNADLSSFSGYVVLEYTK